MVENLLCADLRVSLWRYRQVNPPVQHTAVRNYVERAIEKIPEKVPLKI